MSSEELILTNLRNSVSSQYEKACDNALKVVEILARKIMTDNPDFCDFCMAMGSWSFSYEVGSFNEFMEENRTSRKLVEKDLFEFEFEELDEFINEWDRYLKLTGNPVRIDNAKAPIVTDW